MQVKQTVNRRNAAEMFTTGVGQPLFSFNVPRHDSNAEFLSLQCEGQPFKSVRSFIRFSNSGPGLCPSLSQLQRVLTLTPHCAANWNGVLKNARLAGRTCSHTLYFQIGHDQPDNS